MDAPRRTALSLGGVLVDGSAGQRIVYAFEVSIEIVYCPV
jgi:hypothetical protein